MHIEVCFSFVVYSLKKDLVKKKDTPFLDSLISQEKPGCYLEWMKKIDRGGLTYVSRDCFRFFFPMEKKINSWREKLQEEDITRTEVQKAIKEDVDVMYDWDECMQQE